MRFLWLLILIAVPATAQQSLLPNGGFEAGAGADPEGWRFSWEQTHQGDPRPTLKQKPDFAWDEGEHHSGGHSVRVGVARAQDDGVWTSQPFPGREGARIYRVRAWVKTRDVKGTQAHLALVASDAAGKWLGADYDVTTAEGTQDWRQIAGFFEAPAGTARLVVRLWMNFHYSGTGTAWFDDVEVVPTELQELPPVRYLDESPMPALRPEQQRAGYALFRKSPLEMLFPETRPRAAEMVEDVDIAAAPGEYEPAVVAVRALRELKGVRVTVSPLAREGGGEIPASACEVRWVRYLERQGQSRWGPYQSGRMRVPVFLEKRPAAAIAAETTQPFWVTVKVPEGAQAGVYRGSIEVAPEGAPATRLRFSVQVWPFRLAEPRGLYFGMYSKYHAEPGYLDRIYRDMREHGMTTVGFGGALGAKLERDGERVRVTFDGTGELEQALAAYRKAGFPQPILWLMGSDVQRWCLQQGPLESDAFASCYRQVIEAIEARRRAQGWPEILYQPIDEPFEHTAGLPATKRCLQILKQIPGIRTEEDGPNGNPSTLEELYPWCDFLAYHDGPFLRRGKWDKAAWEAFTQRLSRDRKEVWFYNVDLTGYHPEPMRYLYGFGLPATRATGVFSWSYQWGYRADQGDAVYRKPSAYLFAYPEVGVETGGPAIGWEAIREGVDDCRYLATLGEAADAAMESGDPARRRLAEQAEKEMRARLEQIDYGGARGSAAQGDWTGRKETLATGERAVSGDFKMPIGWSFADYDATRRLAADWIIRLTAKP